MRNPNEAEIKLVLQFLESEQSHKEIVHLIRNNLNDIKYSILVVDIHLKFTMFCFNYLYIQGKKEQILVRAGGVSIVHDNTEERLYVLGEHAAVPLGIGE